MKFPCLSRHPAGTVLLIKVQPRSSRNQIVGLQEGELRLKLTSPPVDGAANKTCRDFLSKQFRIAKTSVELVSGETSRHKRILLRGIACEDVEAVLAKYL